MSALNTTGFDEMELEGKLTVKQLRFVNEYLIDSNATQAAIRAGYSEHTASSIGSQLLSNLKVRAALEARLRDVATAAAVSAERIIAELYDIAFTDAREVMELLVRPCRQCWPAGLALEDPNPLCDAPLLSLEGVNLGGCGGVGVQSVKLTPTRKLSRAAAKLISSIKQKKDGSIELEMRSQDKALEMLGRARGVFKDRQEISGPNGGPVPLGAVDMKQLTDEQIMARIAQLQGISGGSSQTIEGNPQELKALPADSAPYVAVTAQE